MGSSWDLFANSPNLLPGCLKQDISVATTIAEFKAQAQSLCSSSRAAGHTVHRTCHTQNPHTIFRYEDNLLIYNLLNILLSYSGNNHVL